MRATQAGSVPVIVVTGFLGSGKSSLIKAMLRSPSFRNAGVIVNEIGEVALDQRLIDYRQEDVMVMKNGCLCCAFRSDLAEALARLFRVQSISALPLNSVVVETSGLASPGPIAQTFMNDRNVRERYRLQAIIACADTIYLPENCERHHESAVQIALADHVIVTKVDIARPEQLRAARETIRALNPAAPIRLSVPDKRERHERDMKRLFAANGPSRRSLAAPDGSHELHRGIFHATVKIPGRVSWQQLSSLLGTIVERHGNDMLRCKAIVALDGMDAPIAVHGVHHLFHPPELLRNESGNANESVFVFIFRSDCLQALGSLLHGRGFEFDFRPSPAR